MKRIFLVAVILAYTAPLLFADGGGGMIFGYQTSSYPFFENYDIRNNNMGLTYTGGYGYGIDRDGNIAGGFGFGLFDGTGESDIGGGFGGFIVGKRFLTRPVNISIVSWTGFGGMYTGEFETESGSGFFCVLEEVALEVGIPVFSWFMPTLYAGYQVAGNLIPGEMFTTFISYTPVVGFRIQWGEFY